MRRSSMLTTYEGDAHILRAVKAGAQGYLLKNTLHTDLLQTIRTVHAGKRSLSPEASFQVAQHVSDDTLTPAELLVLRLIAAGKATRRLRLNSASLKTPSRASQEHSFETRRQRPCARRDHRRQARHHRALAPAPFGAARHRSPTTLKSHTRRPAGGSRRAATTQ